MVPREGGEGKSWEVNGKTPGRTVGRHGSEK